MSSWYLNIQLQAWRFWRRVGKMCGHNWRPLAGNHIIINGILAMQLSIENARPSIITISLGLWHASSTHTSLRLSNHIVLQQYLQQFIWLFYLRNFKLTKKGPTALDRVPAWLPISSGLGNLTTLHWLHILSTIPFLLVRDRSKSETRCRDWTHDQNQRMRFEADADSAI